jgi:hypothetical protein
VIRSRVGAVLGAAALLFAGALRADQFEDAQAEALKNLGGPGGKEYDAKLLANFEERHGKALAECASQVADVDLDPFTVVLELAADGHAKQILLRPANGAAVCLRWSLRGGTFPKPPRAGFWMIAVDPRSRRASAPAIPSPSPLAASALPPTPTATASPGPAPFPTSSRFAPPPTWTAAPRAAPVPTPTPVPPPVPAAAARPAPPPQPSGGVVDVRFAALSGASEGDEALRRREAIDAAQRQRVERGVVSGAGVASLPRLDAWRGSGGGRFLASISVHGSAAPAASELEAIRAARKDGRVSALEILAQSEGVAPDDPRLEPWWALAEELDLPVAIALGPPSPEARDPRYRVALGDPLRLEPVLVRHPRLRLDVSQAGWPFGDSMAAILRAYPQVFVDTGTIAWSLDRRETHAYLRRLVDAGFADRILFASGASEPVPLAHAIDAIESADFLTAEQKRAILHDNAARWLGSLATY